jgi:hypothetical protein
MKTKLIINNIAFLPGKLLILPYMFYIFAQVLIHTPIVEIELMGSDELSKECFKIVEPALKKYKIALRAFSLVVWLEIIFKIFI